MFIRTIIGSGSKLLNGRTITINFVTSKWGVLTVIEKSKSSAAAKTDYSGV